MYLAIDFWYWVLGIWITSQLVWYLFSFTRGVIRACLNILFFLGVIVHEFSHLFFSLIFGVPVERIEIKWRNPNGFGVAPHGKIATGDNPHESFMQGLMISFAPLLMSTFLFFGCIDIITIINTSFFIKIFAIFLAISLILTAAPSKQDLNAVAWAISNDTILAFFQAACFGISLLFSITLINFSKIQLPFEFIYYMLYFLASFIIYFILFYSLKWTGMGIRAIYRKVSRRDNSLSNRSLNRKRIKSKKNPKEKKGEWW
jgi:hypothetical protein